MLVSKGAPNPPNSFESHQTPSVIQKERATMLLTVKSAARTVFASNVPAQKLNTKTTAENSKRICQPPLRASRPTSALPDVINASRKGQPQPKTRAMAAATPSFTSHCNRDEMGRVRCHVVKPIVFSSPSETQPARRTAKGT